MDAASDHPLVRRARELAHLAHATQVRKGGDLPYTVHLDAVAAELAAHGEGDPEVLAAAYLHDLLEDQPAFAERFRREMPGGVVRRVEALSETKRDPETGRYLPKERRFRGYLEQLRQADDGVRRVSCADKIDNLRSLATQRGVLHRLSTRPGEHAPQLALLREVYAPSVPSSLLETFDAACEALFERLEASQPAWAARLATDALLDDPEDLERWMALHLRLRGRDAKVVGALDATLGGAGGWTLEKLAREGFSADQLDALSALRAGAAGAHPLAAEVGRVRGRTVAAPAAVVVELTSAAADRLAERARFHRAGTPRVVLAETDDVAGPPDGMRVELEGIAEAVTDRAQGLRLRGAVARSDGRALALTVSRRFDAGEREGELAARRVEASSASEVAPLEGVILEGVVRRGVRDVPPRPRPTPWQEAIRGYAATSRLPAPTPGPEG
jgi:hypothetical protein